MQEIEQLESSLCFIFFLFPLKRVSRNLSPGLAVSDSSVEYRVNTW